MELLVAFNSDAVDCGMFCLVSPLLPALHFVPVLSDNIETPDF